MKHERFWKVIVVLALALQVVRAEVDWAEFKSFANASVALEYTQTGYLLTLGTQVQQLREFMSEVYGEPHKEHPQLEPRKPTSLCFEASPAGTDICVEIQESKKCPEGKRCG